MTAPNPKKFEPNNLTIASIEIKFHPKRYNKVVFLISFNLGINKYKVIEIKVIINWNGIEVDWTGEEENRGTSERDKIVVELKGINNIIIAKSSR